MGILEAIKKGFGVASKNLALIIVLFIFNLIWNIVNIALLPAGALPTIRTAAATPPAISPQVSLTVFAFSLLFILVSIFMQGGSLGMVRDYIKGGKVKLAQFASYGLKYYLRLLGLGLLIILLVLIAAVIAALIIAATTPLNNIVATVIAAIIAAAIGLAGIYFVVLLVMSPYSLICEEVGVIEAMKRSMRAVKKVFWRVVLLLLLLILIAVGIGFLLGILTGFLTLVISARAGQIVISVVNSLFNGYFGIVMMAAFMTFYFTLAGKEKVV